MEAHSSTASNEGLPRVLLLGADATRRAAYREWIAADPALRLDLVATEAPSEEPTSPSFAALVLDAEGLADTAQAVARGVQETSPGALPTILLLPGGDEKQEPLDWADDVVVRDARAPWHLRRALWQLLERRRLEDELAQERAAHEATRAALAAAAEATRKQIEDMGHDLRSPLNALIGYSEMLMEELGRRRDESLLADAERIRRLARSLLGTVVDVTSEPGTAGARREADANGVAPLKGAPDAQGTAVDRSQDTILIIDDDRDLRGLMAEYLEIEGFHVATASGGEEGLRLARQVRPSAITLDVDMPGMDGWDVLTQLKADPALSRTPVVMLTGRGNERTAVQALRQGVDDYLMKGDISASTLLRTLLGVLEKERLRHAVEGGGQALRAASRSQTGLPEGAGLASLLAEQQDRQRLAHLFHETVVPPLRAMGGYLTELKDLSADGERPAREVSLARLERSLASAVTAARTVGLRLGPPAGPDEYLETALGWLTQELEDVYGLQVEVVAASAFPPARPGVRALLTRAMVDLLGNVVRHAGVHRATVTIAAEEARLRIDVSDRGTGARAPKGRSLDRLAAHLAVLGGRMDVYGTAGEGTRASLLVPLSVLAEEPDALPSSAPGG